MKDNKTQREWDSIRGTDSWKDYDEALKTHRRFLIKRILTEHICCVSETKAEIKGLEKVLRLPDELIRKSQGGQSGEEQE